MMDIAKDGLRKFGPRDVLIVGSKVRLSDDGGYFEFDIFGKWTLRIDRLVERDVEKEEASPWMMLYRPGLQSASFVLEGQAMGEVTYKSGKIEVPIRYL